MRDRSSTASFSFEHEHTCDTSQTHYIRRPGEDRKRPANNLYLILSKLGHVKPSTSGILAIDPVDKPIDSWHGCLHRESLPAARSSSVLALSTFQVLRGRWEFE